jgi:hypothetical protein
LDSRVKINNENSDINVPFDFEGNYHYGNFGSALDATWDGMGEVEAKKNGKERILCKRVVGIFNFYLRLLIDVN